MTDSSEEITPDEVVAIHAEAPTEEPNTEIPDPVGTTLDAEYVCPLCGWACLVEGPDVFDEVSQYHYRGQHPDDQPPAATRATAK